MKKTKITILLWGIAILFLTSGCIRKNANAKISQLKKAINTEEQKKEELKEFFKEQRNTLITENSSEYSDDGVIKLEYGTTEYEIPGGLSVVSTSPHVSNNANGFIIRSNYNKSDKENYCSIDYAFLQGEEGNLRNNYMLIFFKGFGTPQSEGESIKVEKRNYNTNKYKIPENFEKIYSSNNIKVSKGNLICIKNSPNSPREYAILQGQEKYNKDSYIFVIFEGVSELE